MFWKKRLPEDEEEDEPDHRRPTRRIFGFQCSPDIHISAKAIAKQLYVDLYVVAEHALQLGLIDISAAMKDPDELEMLRKHLHEAHTIKRLVESVSNYDSEAAEYIREGQARQYHKEQATRDLVELWSKYGLDPRIMKEVIIQELKRIIATRHNSAEQ